LFFLLIKLAEYPLSTGGIINSKESELKLSEYNDIKSEPIHGIGT
jgi:hypothetical protein